MNVMESLCNPEVAKQIRIHLNENETLWSSESRTQSSRVHSPGVVLCNDDFNKLQAFIDAAIGVKRPRLDNLESVIHSTGTVNGMSMLCGRWLEKDSGAASSTICSPRNLLYIDDVKLPVIVKVEEELKMVKRPKLENLENKQETQMESVPLTKKVLWPGLDKESSVRFERIQKELRLFDEEFISLCIREKNRLVSRKKLCLVLDLDHTLLHTTRNLDLKPQEESIFKFDSLKIMTKLRPFVHEFLREASEMFEMYIYTMGNKSYALEMAKLLDPKKEYFNGRVISRQDSTQKHQKSLDVVPVDETVVLILDDKERVWTKHKDNLILLERYIFFPSNGNPVGFNSKSLSEQKTDESKSGGALSTVLKVLKQIHSLYFEEAAVADNLDERDVREVLKGVRKVVLKDCRLVFSQVSPTPFQSKKHPIWRMAEQMGAHCFTEVDEMATHVISANSMTKKSCWALREKKFLVHPRWIETSYYLWQRQPEEKFCIRKPESRCNNPFISTETGQTCAIEVCRTAM